MGVRLKACALALVLFVAAGGGLAARGQSAPVEVEGWDISALDARIAESAAKDKPAAAAAYLERANFFYEAGEPQLYKLALGDFRRVLRLQPENREAREKMQTIVSIYESLRRPVPENGGDRDAHNDPAVRYRLKPQAVELAPEGRSVTVSERLPPRVSYVYELKGGAARGVHLSLETHGGGEATFEVYRGRVGPATRVAAGVTDWRGILSADGPFLIKVTPKEKAVRYHLTVEAGPPAT